MVRLVVGDALAHLESYLQIYKPKRVADSVDDLFLIAQDTEEDTTYPKLEVGEYLTVTSVREVICSSLHISRRSFIIHTIQSVREANSSLFHCAAIAALFGHNWWGKSVCASSFYRISATMTIAFD